MTNVTLQAIINTGSAYNLISPELAYLIRAKVHLLRNPIVVYFGNGGRKRVTRNTILKMTINNRDFLIPFLIFECQAGPLILGLHFLMTAQAKIQIGEESLKMSFMGNQFGN